MNEKLDEIQGKLDLVRVSREFEISEFEISGFYLFYFIYFICHTIITKKKTVKIIVQAPFAENLKQREA